MYRRMKLESYLSGAETTRPRELVYGILREPPAPCVRHQIVVGQLFVRLDRHVRRHRLGLVLASPVDVVLDRERDLVVQPDVVYVSAERLDICTDRIWGAPDLAVEVFSRTTAWQDRMEKLQWFRQYGVRECWLVDPDAERIEVIDPQGRRGRGFAARQMLQSTVLPRLRFMPADVFADP